MKKLNKVFAVLLFAVAIMLLLTVNASATVDQSVVTSEVKTITFDATYYLNSYSDLKAAFGNDEAAAYNHFLTYGISEGRCAKLTFDIEYYLNSYKDLQDAFGKDFEAAYRHFIQYGAAEGRSGCPIYDSAYYAANNKDVKDAFGNNKAKIYEHYAMYGVNEGRQACEEFNVKCYLKKYKDLTDAFTATGYASGFEHYLVYGINENRVATHEYVTTTVEATCEKAGYTLQECACGDTIRTTLPKLGHNFGETEEVTVEDTEAGSNVHKHTCARCGKTEYFDEEHNYGEEPVSTTATCTEAGEETYICSVCGKEDVREVSAYGHDYVLNEGERLTNTKPATCAENGIDEYVCSRCNTTRLVAVQATGEHTLTKTEAKEATCTEAGNNEYYTCSVCNGVFKDAEGKETTTVENETLAVVAHTLTKTEAKPATCTETGNNAYYTCSVCNGVFKDEEGKEATTVEAETLDMIAHSITKVDAVPATCIEAGNNEYYKCSVCDKYFEDENGETEITDKTSVVIPASEQYHAWTAGDPTNYGLTAPTCEADGYTVQVCSTCQAVEISAAKGGHIMTKTGAKAATTTSLGNNEYYTCSRCGGVFKDEAGTQPTTVEAETISTLTVNNLEDLKAVISSGPITTVVLGADITGIDETLSVSKTMTIEGNGKKLQFNEINKNGGEVASALVIGADNTVVNGLTVEMTAQAGWQGNYAIQVYNAEGVKLNNVTAANGDAGIIVNASKVELTGTTTLNNNEFGGIEVSKGTAADLTASELTVTGTIVMNNEAVKVPTIWIEAGENQGTVTGAGVENYYSTDKTNTKGQTYYYSSESVAQKMTVTSLDDLKLAISVDSPVITATLDADITGITETLAVSKTMTIEGNGKKLQFNEINKNGGEVASALVIGADNTVVNGLTVEMTAQAGWQGNYAIQVYNAEGVKLNNVTAANGDAGIIVNASKVELTGTTTLNNNEFGGIEVSKGTAEGLTNGELTVTGTIVMNNEARNIPTIWVEPDQGTVTGAGVANYYSTTETNDKNQTYYYSDESYAQ